MAHGPTTVDSPDRMAVRLAVSSGWVAALAGVGSALYFSGAVKDVNPGIADAVGFLVLIQPVTVVLARLESGARGATVER